MSAREARMACERQPSLGAELRAAAREVPDKVFLRMRGLELSFARVDELSDTLARLLAA